MNYQSMYLKIFLDFSQLGQLSFKNFVLDLKCIRSFTMHKHGLNVQQNKRKRALLKAEVYQ